MPTSFLWQRVLILCLVAPSAAAQSPAPATYSPGARMCVLRDFGGQVGDPMWPSAPGVFAKGADGDLYTTSPSGGQNGDGTIFKVSPSTGAFAVLVDFDVAQTGRGPVGGLVNDGGNWMYGTTFSGGRYPVGKGQERTGAGTLFRFSPDSGALERLHTFRNGALAGIEPESCPDKDKPCKYSPQQRLNAAGGYPVSAPVRATDGSFYGVAAYSQNQKYGVLYKVQPYKGESGITALCTGGAVPSDPDITDAQLRAQCLFSGAHSSFPMTLTPGPDGRLYGVTWGYAKGDFGTVFRADTSGKLTTLHRFSGTDGARPHSVVVLSDGGAGVTLYGTTLSGGMLPNGKAGAGVVYTISSAGTFDVLHTFDGTADGAEPLAGLTAHTDGSGTTYLYGAARYGGEHRGVLYRVKTTGEFEVLHRHPWRWGATGRKPMTTLFEHDGNFYGTTYEGGAHDGGVIFRLSGIDLPPVRNLNAPPKFYGGVVAATEDVAVEGQKEPVVIEVRTGVKLPPFTIKRKMPPAPACEEREVEVRLEDGITIDVQNCRNPHILQFIHREKRDVTNQLVGGGYAPGTACDANLDNSYQFTTDPDNPAWHTDGSSGKPNAYYDQGNGTPRITGPFSVKIFDQPSFAKPIFNEGAHETWRATFKSYVVCNCKVVSEVHWTREVRWEVDLSGGPNVLPDLNKGKQLPAEYVDVKIVPPSDPDFTWANEQVKKDGYAPVP
ncbi:MAG: hypothetical protein KIS79_07815 [Burkholderiales bacterium]|nr:hypothetical protein [Burkholderiales bacterium]